jgi:glucokinase
LTFPRGTLLLGLDIGGTKSAACVGDRDGHILARVAGPTLRDWRDALPFFVASLHQACAEASYSLPDIAALGVSCGGPLDSSTGVVYSPPNLPGWDAVPLKAFLEGELGLPVFVENDANATALAEHRWGAGRGCADMAFLTMGTGIGSGLILSNALYRGRGDLAGEIGHATVWPDGPPCLCGKRGCLETLASGTAIGRISRERYGDDSLTAQIVCDRARSGDPVALQIIAEVAHWMGLGLANLLHTLNLERIILGTLAVHAGDLLLDPIRRETERHCWPRLWDGVQILPAALGDASQDLAALAVAQDVRR